MSIENWPMWLKTWRKWLQRTSKSPKLPKILKVAKILKSCRKVAEQLVAKPIGGSIFGGAYTWRDYFLRYACWVLCWVSCLGLWKRTSDGSRNRVLSKAYMALASVCSFSVCCNELFVGNFIWGVPHMLWGTKLTSNKNAKSNLTLLIILRSSPSIEHSADINW